MTARQVLHKVQLLHSWHRLMQDPTGDPILLSQLGRGH